MHGLWRAFLAPARGQEVGLEASHLQSGGAGGSRPGTARGGKIEFEDRGQRLRCQPFPQVCWRIFGLRPCRALGTAGGAEQPFHVQSCGAFQSIGNMSASRSHTAITRVSGQDLASSAAQSRPANQRVRSEVSACSGAGGRKRVSISSTPSGRPVGVTASVRCTGSPFTPFPPPPNAASPSLVRQPPNSSAWWCPAPPAPPVPDGSDPPWTGDARPAHAPP